MKRTILLFTNCSKNEDEQNNSKTYTTIVGNTYSAKSIRSYDSRDAYLIYKMNTNGTISQEIRLDSSTGEVYQTRTNGSYVYNYPSLELKLQSITDCPDCFNNFTATVDNDFKSFSYTIFDLPTLSNKKLLFNIME